MKVSQYAASNTGGDQLRSFAARIQRIEAEKDALTGDIREIYAEAGAKGFDKKVIRMCIRELKIDPAEREEQRELFDLYMGVIQSPGTKQGKVKSAAPAPAPKTKDAPLSPIAKAKASGNLKLAAGRQATGA